MSVVRSGETGWKPLQQSGVVIKVLRSDKATGASTFLLRFDAGARFPLHDHPGGEEVFVVEGDLRGRPSHGAQRLPVIAERIRRGLIRPGAPQRAVWTAEVLACTSDPAACQRVIIERQREIDADNTEAEIVRAAIIERLLTIQLHGSRRRCSVACCQRPMSCG